jgi:pimeloyl-ACP methyl ester carboxylesterase
MLHRGAVNAWRKGASVVAGPCDYRLLRLDLPGFGDSPITQLPTTYAADWRPVGRPLRESSSAGGEPREERPKEQA